MVSNAASEMESPKARQLNQVASLKRQELTSNNFSPATSPAHLTEPKDNDEADYVLPRTAS
ncbi:rCG29642, isoform CRA_a [Rattus norvegicus]|uniref:RCG29642, isoform CRA_a n=1 Tax=Rattus norvegicus TaxID=10116 RepID=A6ILV8_RAT|nr:rCG29642, isoform CRA_a [Rattus norvegicus]EDM01832.1 rCG29642, isoform CRA_a [Rattus norvegicus]